MQELNVDRRSCPGFTAACKKHNCNTVLGEFSQQQGRNFRKERREHEREQKKQPDLLTSGASGGPRENDRHHHESETGKNKNDKSERTRKRLKGKCEFIVRFHQG